MTLNLIYNYYDFDKILEEDMTTKLYLKYFTGYQEFFLSSTPHTSSDKIIYVILKRLI